MSIVILMGVAGIVLQILYWKRPKGALEHPVTNIRSVSRLVSSCGIFFKIIIFPVGPVSCSFRCNTFHSSGKCSGMLGFKKVSPYRVNWRFDY